jgi:hypothetical protein
MQLLGTVISFPPALQAIRGRFGTRAGVLMMNVRANCFNLRLGGHGNRLLLMENNSKWSATDVSGNAAFTKA